MWWPEEVCILRKPVEYKEATWEENTSFYRENPRFVTISHWDGPKQYRLWLNETNKLNGVDHVPENFFSYFFIQTHNGNFKVFYS